MFLYKVYDLYKNLDGNVQRAFRIKALTWLVFVICTITLYAFLPSLEAAGKADAAWDLWMGVVLVFVIMPSIYVIYLMTVGPERKRKRKNDDTLAH